MGLFTRKSKWDHLREAVVAAAGNVGLRQVAKVTLGVVSGVVGVTAVSAAVSSVRHQDET